MVIQKRLKKNGRKHAWSKDMLSDKDLAGNTKTTTQGALADQGQGWRWASLASSGGPEMMLTLKRQQDMQVMFSRWLDMGISS